MCSICNKSPCDSRCPNYSSQKNTHIYCSICKEPIGIGEEYVENIDGDFAHYGCFYGIRHLLEWLGHDVKTMDEIGE